MAMVTVKETTSRDLDTPEEISDFLRQRFAERGRSAFEPGEVVGIAQRGGIPPGFAIGDVAVFLCQPPDQPFAYILCLNAAGADIVFQVSSSNLAKRDVT